MDNHDLRNMYTLDGIACIYPGDVLVDVGACRGIYTDFFAKRLMGTGKIYCIELNPENFENLNSLVSDHPNIECINAAISDVDGFVDYYGGQTETFNILGHNTSFEELEKEGSIQSITLDTLLKDDDKIKVIKIDVEGAELQVLRGMKDAVKRTEVILLENHFDEDWEEIREILLEEYGFTCYNIEIGTKLEMSSPRPYQCLCVK